MELKKSAIAKMFGVSILTVDNWEKQGKINRIENQKDLRYDLKSVLSMAEQSIFKIENKRLILEKAIEVLKFEIKQDELYHSNLELYNKSMGIKK